VLLDYQRIPKTLGFGILLRYNCTKLQQSDQDAQEHGK
jgi:hypothetical protein